MSDVGPVPGDILWWKGDKSKLINRVIMRRTNSEYVHVAVVAYQGLIVQAVTGGVEIALLPDPPTYAAVASTGNKLQHDDPANFLKAMRGMMCFAGNTPYGFLDIVSQLLMLLPGSLSISADRSVDCSHLATLWLQSAGFDLPFGTEPNRVTPGSLFTILSAAGVPIRIVT